MTIDLTPIFQAVLALLAAIITAFVIPWIKAKTTAQQQERLAGVYRTIVFAAEQMFGAGHGEDKLAFVEDWLKARGYEVDMALIEATVKSHFGHWDLIPIHQDSHPPEETD